MVAQEFQLIPNARQESSGGEPGTAAGGAGLGEGSGNGLGGGGGTTRSSKKEEEAHAESQPGGHVGLHCQCSRAAQHGRDTERPRRRVNN